MPELDDSVQIEIREIRNLQPEIAIEPLVGYVTYYNATFNLKLWDKGKVFAVLIEYNPDEDTSISNGTVI
jgi:hypothetical protein